MIDYEKVCKSLAYLIETMNGFQDEVLKYKYSKVLVHYKNYIENCASPLSKAFNSVTRLYNRVQTMTKGNHNNYLYFPHLEEKCEVVNQLVNIETVSQLQHDLLVKAGMDATNELIASDGINVTFRVTSDVAEKYNSLLEFCIEEYKAIIAQSE